jgi:hypothetical protein
MKQDASGAGQGGKPSQIISHRHHTHITDIAENAINVIMILVEGLGGDSVTSQI